MGTHMGWQGNRPNQTVNVTLSGASVPCHVMFSGTVQPRPGSKVSLSDSDFLKYAKDLDLSALARDAKARQFTTGSIGWNAHDTITVKVYKHSFKVNRNFNAVLMHTK